MNVLSTITNVENLRFESCSFAFLAHKLDVGKKLHFNGYGAIALTHFHLPPGTLNEKKKDQTVGLGFAVEANASLIPS